MKNYIIIKRNLTRILILSMLPTDVFSASPETKQMIQSVLSKYCIPNDKTLCNTPYEGKYDPDTPFCLCNDGMTYNAESRKCQECTPGTYYRQSMRDNSCKSCHPGSYSGAGAAGCTSCSPGTYASGYGNTGCASCSPGTYQSSRGASLCYNCSSSNCETSGWGATSCYSRCGGNYMCNGYGECICYLQPTVCTDVVNCTHVNKCSGRYYRCNTVGDRAGDCYYEKVENRMVDFCDRDYSDYDGNLCTDKYGPYLGVCTWNDTFKEYYCPHSISVTIRVYANGDEFII